MQKPWLGVSAVLAVTMLLCAGCGGGPSARPTPNDPAASPAPSETASEPGTPPVREQLTIDFPPFIPVPEGIVKLQQQTPVNNDNYWNLSINTDTPFEEAVAPLLAAGSADSVTFADGRGPGLADGTGSATVFIGGYRVSLSVSRVGLQEHEFWASYSVQPGAQGQLDVRAWPQVSKDVREWTTAPQVAVPAAFPADLPLPHRAPHEAHALGEIPGLAYEGVDAARARWLTRDETEFDSLVQTWVDAGWEREILLYGQGAKAIVRKGDIQVLLEFDYTPFFNAWGLMIVVWDPAA